VLPHSQPVWWDVLWKSACSTVAKVYNRLYQRTNGERQKRTTKPGFAVRPSAHVQIGLFQPHLKVNELLPEPFGQAVAKLLKMLFNARNFGSPFVYVNSQQVLDVLLWNVQAG